MRATLSIGRIPLALGISSSRPPACLIEQPATPPHLIHMPHVSGHNRASLQAASVRPIEPVSTSSGSLASMTSRSRARDR